MEKTIKLVQFLNNTDAVSIEDGEKLFEEIKSLISDNTVCILDFTGIESCITRFLNPAIGQLLGSFNRTTLNNYVKFTNLKDSFVDKLKAVISNASNFYSNKESYNKIVEEVL